MSAIETITEIRADEGDSECESQTIRCYLDVALILRTQRTVLSVERLLAAQALRLLMRLDAELRKARADWSQDRFRRIMKARPRAVLRVLRRWSRLDQPSIPLGNLRRRYHANLACYLYETKK